MLPVQWEADWLEARREGRLTRKGVAAAVPAEEELAAALLEQEPEALQEPSIGRGRLAAAAGRGDECRLSGSAAGGPLMERCLLAAARALLSRLPSAALKPLSLFSTVPLPCSAQALPDGYAAAGPGGAQQVGGGRRTRGKRGGGGRAGSGAARAAAPTLRAPAALRPRMPAAARPLQLTPGRCMCFV